MSSMMEDALPPVLESAYAEHDFELGAEPNSREWIDAPRVAIERDYLGRAIAGPRTEVRSRWTDECLHLLFVCPYDRLNVKPGPPSEAETPQLWNWDVAEAFIGCDEEHIGHYREFQVSPRGEWIDLDIDRQDPTGRGMGWDSGFTVCGRIDAQSKVWYGEMRIPFSALDSKPPRPGRQLRVGLYRIANAQPDRTYYAWSPTGQTTFHVPEAFGILRLR